MRATLESKVNIFATAEIWKSLVRRFAADTLDLAGVLALCYRTFRDPLASGLAAGYGVVAKEWRKSGRSFANPVPSPIHSDEPWPRLTPDA